MSAHGFPLTGSNWYFSQSHIDHKWRIEISHGDKVVVDVQASNEQLVCKRAWYALREYCFRGFRTVEPDPRPVPPKPRNF